jgi:diacylglycerol O-acyltransferase
MPSLRNALGPVAGAWLLWRLFGPRIPPRFEGPQQSPPHPPGRSVLVGRHEFFVRESGPADGPPLLLIHGWAFESVFTWARLTPLLEGRYRLIAVDLRNHGRSGRFQETYEIADLADDVAGILAALGRDRTAVLGYSMGGMVAQALTRRHPALVDRLILGATAANPIPVPGWLGAAVFGVGKALARFDPIAIPRVLHRYLLAVGAVPGEQAAWLWDILLDRDPDLYYEGAFAINRFDARSWVGGLAPPVLFVIPTRDQLVAPRLQRETAALIPGVRVMEIEGARHEAILTHAEEIAKAVHEFVE